MTLTLNLTEAVTVAGGTPTLTLNDGGTATYSGGSGSSALTFSYTVGAGQNTAGLVATAVNLNAATVSDGAGNAANLSLSGLTQSGPQIDTTTPSVAAVVASGTGITSGTGDLDAGKTVTLTLNLTEAVTVAGGTPTLSLNDGGTATYSGGSGSSALTFSYTVGAGQNTPDLTVTAVNLNSATVTDGAGNAANLTGAVTNPAGTLQIDTTTPTISAIAEVPSSGDLNAGKTVIYTLTMSEVVTVNTTGGSPTLSLNDGGTATYSGGSGSSALTFSYTVLAGQNTPDLTVTAVNLNSASIADGAGNAANLSLSGLTQGSPQVDTTTPTISSLVKSPSSGDLDAGKTVTLTLNLTEAVTVAGGTPTLTLNDGGTATYSGGSGSSALTFSYTVGAGQNTAALTATAVNLNAATISDGAGNVANLSLSGLTQSGPQIDTTTPAAPTITSFSPDTGVVGDDITNATTLTLAGTAAANSTVEVFDGSAELGTATANSSGVWNYTTGTLSNGSHGFTAQAVDVAGNVSAASAILTVTVDTVAPPAPIIASDTINGDNSVTLSGTAVANSTVELFTGLVEIQPLLMGGSIEVLSPLTTTPANSSGAWSYTTGTLANGPHSFAAEATDAAGNVSTMSAAVTLTVVPVASVAPAISSLVESPSSGDLDAGKTVTLTLNLTEAVTVAGGTPTLTLNDGGTATYSGGSGSSALTFSYTVLAGQNTPDLTVTAVNLNSASIADGAGNVANLSLSGLTQSGPQIDTTTPSVAAVVASGTGITSGTGDLDAGKTVTLTLNLTEAVTVAGGTPTLTLNDGGTATYSGGSGSSALTFSYTVGAGQNTPDLTVTAVNLNSATVTDGAGNAANLTGAVTNPAGTLQIDTTTPTISAIAEVPSSGDLNAGKTVIYTLTMSEVVTVNTTGGSPTLSLNDGGTATYSGGSGSSALTFSYTVGAGQNTAALTATAVNLNAATISDGAGNVANLSLSGLTQSGPQIDTTTPSVASVVASGTGITSGTGDLDAGKTVTLTLNLTEAVTVAGGTPTLTLNDGGTATYASGSGTSALTFSYTVGAGQNTPDLTVTAVNLNSATVTDGGGNAANLTGAVTNPAGTLQIDTTTPTISSLVESPSSGDLDAGKTVTLTLNLTEAVTVAGGTPTLTLNDGGSATYTGGSGSSALTFSYTVGAGQNTAALAATAVNLNSATVTDGAGNAANLSLSGLTQSGPQIDTTTPGISSLVESPSSGDLDAGKTVTLTLNLTEAVTVAGGTPTLTLNDGGTATYSGGSGSSALTFSYTVGAGQNTAGLVATAVNLNAATVSDGAGNAANLSLSGLTQSGPQIDTTTPTISSLVESPSSGDLDAGKTVTLTLNLTEAVTVAGGTPTLTLNDGGTATYSGGSGSSALTFSYTVGAGQNTAGLVATAVNLNAATVSDGAGNAANLSLSGLTQSGPQIDTTTPSVAAVVASGTGITSGTGDLDAGKTVTLTLNLTEAVTVAGGTPTLSLNDGGTATYSGGSGSSALTFSYTVGAGQNTPDLTVTAVNLNSATVTDGAGNAANLTGAVTNPAGTLQIDTTTPTISAIAEVPSSGDLNAGKTVIYTLTMSEVVTVNTTGGSPTLSLNDGGTATYSGGSGSSALTFSYTVLAGQNTPDLTVTAVNLNSASIADGAGNAANLSLSGLTQGSPQVDTTTPTISSLVESPSSGDLDAGKTVTLTLNLTEAVTVAGGTPTLTLNDGGTATYSGGSGSSALTFNYTVGAGQNTAALTATAVNLNAATISDGAGNVANLSLSGLTQSGPQIDTTTPSVASVVASGTGITSGTGDLDAGKTVTLTLNLTEAVTVAGGTPTLTLNDGGTATYASGSGTSALTFSYTVGAGQNTPDLTVTAVNLNSATVTDGGGNAANLTGAVTNPAGTLQIDTTTPTISSLVESPSSGDLDAGKTVTLTLNLTEAVTVAGGTPTLTLNDGGTATYSGGSGSSALTFSYTVGAGQNTAALTATAVNLNAATISDGAGNVANLSLSGLTQSGPQIDTTTPSVASVVASGTGITSGTGDLDAGKTVTLTLNLTEAVTVAGGTPTLTLNDGGTATYASGSGTSALTFSYTVGAGQNTPDLTVTAVNLNSATVTDGGGNAANLTGAVTNPAGTLQIDTTTPTISSLVESPSSGDLDAGKTVTLTLNLTEAVTVAGGTPTLTLNDGGSATYTGGSGSSALTFSYTVGAGQNTAALAATAVNLNSATVTDGAGNAANLSLSGLTQSGPQIDTTTPGISSLVESPSSGDLDAGKTVTLTLNLTEAVTVAGGTPTLTLNDGGTATYSGGSGSSALTFSYTVGAGQNTAGLVATAVNLNAATVSDGAGNAANLSLSGLTQSGPQIDTTTPAAPVIANDTVNGNNSVTLSGTAETNDAVAVFDGSTELGTTTANRNGAWSFTTGALATGSQTITATASDAAGNTSAASNAVDPIVGQVTGPAVSSLVQSPSSGDLDAGNTVTLTLNLNEAVTVAGGIPSLTLNDRGAATYTGGSGTSALTFSYRVGAGQNTPNLAVTAVNLNSATITDGSGNGANLSLFGLIQGGPQIDTTAPAAPIITSFSPDSGVAGDDLTNAAVLTLTGTAATNSTVEVFDGSTKLGTTTANGNGAWSYTTGTLSNGSHSFTAQAVDTAGNVSVPSATLSVTVDTVPPATPLIATDSISGNDSVSLSGTAQANTTVTVYDEQAELGTTLANASGVWAYTTGVLTAGTQAFTATATDAAGNVSAASTALSVTIDAPPAAPVIAADTVNGNTVTLAGASAADSTVTVYALHSLLSARVDLGTTQANAGGSWNFTTGALASGAYIFYATATNAAGTSSFSAGLDPEVGQAATPTASSAPLTVAGTEEIAQASSANIAFQSGNPGVLVLDQPSTFTGTVSGFGAQNAIDLPSIAFDAQTTLGYLPNTNQAAGTLSVTDGSHSANIALLGNYIASSFAVVGDNHGGTMVVSEASQSGTQSLLTNPQHT